MAEYLKRFARQTTEREGAKTYVATPEDDDYLVIGFYTITPSEMSAEEILPEFRKGLGRYPLPGYRLARLAVDRRYEGMGLGRRLLFNAGARCLRAATEVGGRVMYIDAKDEAAAGFYLRFGAVQAMPDNPLKLLWPLATLRSALEKA